MVRNSHSILQVLLALLLPVAALAQVAGVDISVTPRSGSIDSTFEILVTVDPTTVDSQPELMPSDDFAVIGTSTRTQTFITNGNVSNQYAYAFSLKPLKTGKLKLPDVQIQTRSRLVQLPVGVIDVTETSSTASLVDNKKILFHQSVSKLSVYQGEQVRNVFEILSDTIFRDVEFPAPSFPGFWVEAREKDRSGSRIQNSKRIFYYETSRSLYPLSTGTIPLESKEIALRVRDTGKQKMRLSNFPLSIFSQSAPKRITLKSNPLEIEVAPLPPAPANAAFWSDTALVGSTQMRAQFDPGAIKNGESKTIHITISTVGNANPIKSLPLDSTKKYRVYQEAPQVTYTMEGGLLKMELMLSASIVPQSTGSMNIPPLRLTYFNVEEEQFKTITTKPLGFMVHGDSLTEENNSPETATPSEPEAPTSVPQATPAPEPKLPAYSPATVIDELLQTVSLGTLVFVALLLFLLSLFAWLLLPLVRAQSYAKKVKRRIQGARNPSELSRVFEAHIKKMTGIKPGAFKKSELANELQHYIENRSLLFAIQAFLDSLEQSAFNPTATIDTEQLQSEALMIVEAWQ